MDLPIHFFNIWQLKYGYIINCKYLCYQQRNHDNEKQLIRDHVHIHPPKTSSM